MKRMLNFISGADKNGVSGGYLYNLHLRKMLRAKNFKVVCFDGRQSLQKLDPTVPTIVDSLILNTMCQQLNQYFDNPILLMHLPPELNKRHSQKSKANDVSLTDLIERSQIVTTGNVCYEYMQEQYNLAHDALHLIEPGLIKNWRSKKYYRSLPRKLITVASLIPGKGYELILPALAECMDLDWQFTFYGDKSFEPEFAEEINRLIEDLGISDRVRYEGTLSQMKLNMAMVESDMLLQCSPFETYSMVTNEAIGACLPVLSTRTGNHQAFSQSGLVTYLEDGSLTECISKLRRLLMSKEEYAKLRPLHSLQNRSWLEVANDFEELFK